MSDNGAHERLGNVCRAAAAALAADGAATTLMTDSGPSLAYATDQTSAQLEREQQTCGEGPSLSAFARQAPVVVDDLHGDEARRAWPLLAHAVDAIRVGLFVALPVSVGGIRLGVLSVYNRTPGDLSPSLLPAAALAADSAGLALLDAEGASADVVPLSALGPVLDYRIHQATGMVMVQTGLGARDALTRLRARAFTESVPLHHLASDVVAHRVRFEPEK